MPSPRLDEATFKLRFRRQFADSAFDPLEPELTKMAHAAWDAYAHSRKSPHTRKTGAGFADPDYDIAADWLKARDAVAEAQRQHEAPGPPNRVLLINGSPRSEHTCPGEMSKSFRLMKLAEHTFIESEMAVDILDLSRVTSEYGLHIYPCKACFSTSPALCHWPCSCYPTRPHHR
jgi:hypothetical protein